MRSLSTFLTVILLLFFALGCKQKHEFVLLEGKIENISRSVLTIEGFGYRKNIQLGVDGQFSDTMHIPEDGIYEIGTIEEYLLRRFPFPIFLSKGTSLELIFDFKNYQDTKVVESSFSGETFRENTYLVDKANFVHEHFSKRIYSDAKIYQLKESDFIKEIDRLYSYLVDLLTSSMSSRAFQDIEKKALEYDVVKYLTEYEYFHGMYSGDNEFEVSATFPHLSFPLYDEWSYKHAASYRFLLRNMLEDSVAHLAASGRSRSLCYLDVLKGIPSKYIKNSALMEFSLKALKPEEDLSTVFDFYMEHSTKEVDKNVYEDIYSRLKMITPGNVSPTFKYENITGGTTSLADLRGKYVYIDIWATWCGPCLIQIPYLMKVKEKFKSDNIVFVGISIDQDKDYEKWRKMVLDYDMGGIQLIADKDRDSDFVQKYSVMTLPRFILLDPAGRIILNDAPRPSASELEDVLLPLLRPS